MDLKDLNKPQLILLAVLLSFVTSIATGITTVTLMQQAPSSFTVPVSRVVRQTVEKIEQVEGKTITQTVIIKEEDLIVDAIAKSKEAAFDILLEDSNTESGYQTISIGFVISDNGVVVTDAALVYSGPNYVLANSSGKFRAEFISSSPEGYTLLQIGNPIEAGAIAKFTVPDFGNFEEMQAGQTIILSGKTIATSRLTGDGSINLMVSKQNSGGMILNLDGQVLGVALSGTTANFVSIQKIVEAL